MEEALKEYFIASGFYALRGVKVVFHDIDVTDIDVWLYTRTSPVSRHRVVVDAKNRKTPQAMERIFWVSGIKAALGLEQAIVATNDKREIISEFGRQYGVMVLGGSFLLRLMKSRDESTGRITDEAFAKLIDGYNLGKLSGDWKARLERSKSLVATLDYNSVNFWLSEARFFAEQSILLEKHRATALRICYLISSLVAIGMDYLLKDVAFVDGPSRRSVVEDGLRHGSSGATGMRRALEFATGLAEQYLVDGASAAHRMREGLKQGLADLPTDILTDYFSRSGVAASLFAIARELEAAAYNVNPPEVSDLSGAVQAFLGALLDYWHLDRVKFFRSVPAATQSETSVAEPSGNIENGSQEKLPLSTEATPLQ
jgi:hypothetical protein